MTPVYEILWPRATGLEYLANVCEGWGERFESSQMPLNVGRTHDKIRSPAGLRHRALKR